MTPALVTLMILLSAGRIVSTYRTFSEQEDEPPHIADGLDWWQPGLRIASPPEHPPLARIFIAAPLHFQGIRYQSFINQSFAGNTALLTGGRFAENLAWVRLGNLPFWILACIFLFAVARLTWGEAPALLALLFFSTLPPALGIAGWAYTDMALVAGMLFFAWRWVAVIDRPNVANGCWLGVSIGFAVMSKYSAIPYIVLATGFTALLAIRERGTFSLPARATWNRAGALLLWVMLTAFLFSWACFRFTVEPTSAKPTHASVDKRLGSTGVLHQMADTALATPLPLAGMIRGLAQLVRHAGNGQVVYNLGAIRRKGTLYYFPILLAVTIPVGLLALMIWGGLSLRRVPHGAGIDFRRQVLLTIPAAILSVNLFSSINFGYRHNLAFYPFVCLVAGIGVVYWWSRGQTWMRALVMLLVGQHLVSSAMAHPDYASFFNFLAGRHPERICLASIGGGDEYRLAARLKQLNAAHVCLGLMHDVPLDALGLPPYTLLKRNLPCEGLVAVALRPYYFDPESPEPGDTGLAWLHAYEPAERIGSSILLFRVPESPANPRNLPQPQR